LSMVGCGGLGPANAGAVIMARAAAKALAIAAAAGMFFAFMRAVLSKL
jgi:hypothetical protein